ISAVVNIHHVYVECPVGIPEFSKCGDTYVKPVIIRAAFRIKIILVSEVKIEYHIPCQRIQYQGITNNSGENAYRRCFEKVRRVLPARTDLEPGIDTVIRDYIQRVCPVKPEGSDK